MIDFATATFAVVAKYIAEKLAADTDRNDGWVIRSLLVLVETGSANEVLVDFAAKVHEWKLGHSDYHHPLSLSQFMLAKGLVSRRIATLAKIARAAKTAAPVRQMPSQQGTAAVAGHGWEGDRRLIESVAN